MRLPLLLIFFVLDVFASGVPSVRVKGGISRLIDTVVDVIVSDKVTSDEYQGGNKKESPDGTGFIIDENGYIITNCHVIDFKDKIKIILYDGNEYTAKIIGKDVRSDIALLKIDTDNKLPFVQFADSDKAEIGDPVIAIGNPFGFGKTVTSGIVSYKGRNLSHQIAELGTGGDLVYYLQTDAAINYGNSGGPLFSYNGEVIGMITVFFSDGMHNTGINFAIPSNTLKRVIKELKDHGKTQHSWLGIFVSPLTKKTARALGMRKQHGCVITKVENDSPAANAGIQVGDLLISLNDEAITEDTNLEYMLNNLPIGKVIPIQIMRHGIGRKLSIRVETKDNDDSLSNEYNTPEKKEIPYEKIDEIGVGVTELTADLRKSFDIQNNINGVMISHTGNLQRNDIVVGSVILMVNQSNVSTVEDLKAELRKLSEDAEIRKNKELALYIFNSQSHRSDYVVIDFNPIIETSPPPSNKTKQPFFQTKKPSKMVDILKNFKSDLKTKWHLF